jgi:hypothetical protein
VGFQNSATRLDLVFCAACGAVAEVHQKFRICRVVHDPSGFAVIPGMCT